MSNNEQSKATNRYLKTRRDLTPEEFEKARDIINGLYDFLDEEERNTAEHEWTQEELKTEHAKASPLQRYNVDIIKKFRGE